MSDDNYHNLECLPKRNSPEFCHDFELKRMRILLISPTIDAEKRTNKGLMMPQLSLHILAGLTPPEYEVTLVEEEDVFSMTA